MNKNTIVTFIIFYTCFLGCSSYDDTADHDMRALNWIEVIPCNKSKSCFLIDHAKAKGLSMEEYLSTHILGYAIDKEKSYCTDLLLELSTRPVFSESLERFNITIGRYNCSGENDNPLCDRFESKDFYTVISQLGKVIPTSSCLVVMKNYPFQLQYEWATNILISYTMEIDLIEKAKEDPKKSLVLFQKQNKKSEHPFGYVLISDMKDVMHVSWKKSQSEMLTIDVYQPSDCQKPIKSLESLMSCRTEHFSVNLSDTLEDILCKVYTAALGGMKSKSNRSIDLYSQQDNSWYPIVEKLFKHCDVVTVFAYKKPAADVVDAFEYGRDVVNAWYASYFEMEEIKRIDGTISLTLSKEQLTFLNKKLRMKENGQFYLHARQMGYFAYTGDADLLSRKAFIEMKSMMASAVRKTTLGHIAFNGETDELYKLTTTSNRLGKEFQLLKNVTEKEYEVLKKRDFTVYLYYDTLNSHNTASTFLLEEALLDLKGKNAKTFSVFSVNCNTLLKQCQGDGITTFPQVVLYRSGEAITYEGSYTKQDFVNLLLLSSYPRIIKINSEEEWLEMTNFFLEDLTNYIIGVNLEKHEEAWKAFESSSKKMQTNQAFVSLHTENYVQDMILARLQEKNETLNDSYLIALSYIEYPELILHEGPLTMESVKKFALTAQYDRLIQLTWSRFVALSKLSRPLLLIFFKSAAWKDVNVLNEINLIFRSQITTALPDMNEVEFLRLFKTYGLNQTPGYALYKSDEKTVHVYAGNVSKIDELRDWLQDALTEKIVPNIKLLKIPFGPQFRAPDITNLVYPKTSRPPKVQPDFMGESAKTSTNEPNNMPPTISKDEL